nr:formin-like protein 6 [Lolium perenne]
MRSTLARRFRRASELEDGGELFWVSRWCVWRRQRCRAAPKSVAFLPCLPVAAAECRPYLWQRRARVAVVGVSGGFVVARRCSTCSEVVQGVLELARRCVASGVRGARMCDASGILPPPATGHGPAAPPTTALSPPPTTATPARRHRPAAAPARRHRPAGRRLASARHSPWPRPPSPATAALTRHGRPRPPPPVRRPAGTVARQPRTLGGAAEVVARFSSGTPWRKQLQFGENSARHR